MLRVIIVGLPGLILAGYAATASAELPDVSSQTAAGNLATSVSPAPYSPIVDGYTPRNPVSPSGWRGTGVDMAPVPESGDSEPEIDQSAGESQPETAQPSAAEASPDPAAIPAQANDTEPAAVIPPEVSSGEAEGSPDTPDILPSEGLVLPRTDAASPGAEQ